MAMQTVYFKEHEGIVHKSVGQLSSVTSSPWSSASGSQAKPFSLEFPNYVDQLAVTKQPGRAAQHVLDKGHITQFTIFPDDFEMSDDAQKHQAAISLQSSLPEPRGHFELKFSQPMICSKYPYMDQFYGLISAYEPQVSGRIMLPLNLASDDGPIYVNAKQYHGIIRRRQSRAKAVLQNKITKRSKPYMHESRHLHAMRRPRGCGGRFLNTRNSSGSRSSEVLQSKVTNGSSPNASGSEVTSMYSRGTLDYFPLNRHGSLADLIDTGRGMVMPTKWVAAAGDCSKL